MSHHLHNEACPKCQSKGADKSKNNLGVFSDGHCLCWSCGYYIHSPSNSRISNIKERVLVELENPRSTLLPEDCSSYIPSHCSDWLSKYEITKQETLQHKLLYSEQRNQLIFPYFDCYENLLAYQARNFETISKSGKKTQKWWSQGDLKKIYHILPLDTQLIPNLVLVEDIVSAIKVSRFAYCMPLFGCVVGLERLLRLSKLTGVITLWLDPDKRKEALKWANKASLFNITGKVIFSDKDPKEHTNEEIRNFLTIS